MIDTEELNGRVRAIEAILLVLADASTLRAAKERLRQAWKNESPLHQQWADLLNKINRPYDQHAEAALDALIREAKSKNS
jgi:hypothetical protein